jgi:hypothetical protein
MKNKIPEIESHSNFIRYFTTTHGEIIAQLWAENIKNHLENLHIDGS